MSSTHCIILCGGRSSRWGGYRKTPRKHLVEIEGELLLDRTLRLVTAYGPARVVVVVNKGEMDLFASRLTKTCDFYEIPPAGPDQTEAYKFLSSKELWNPSGRTIVLLGDVWFSEQAIRVIFSDSTDEWTAFGRIGASRFTGCPHGELFAQRFTSPLEHGENLVRLDALYRERTCVRTASGWAHYQLMIGMDPNIHTVGPRFIEIDDFTEDFDSPEDYDLWMVGRALTVKGESILQKGRKPVVRTAPKVGRNDPCACGSGKKFKQCCLH